MFFFILQQGVIVPAGQGEEGGDNITLLLFSSNLAFYLIKTSSQFIIIYFTGLSKFHSHPTSGTTFLLVLN